MTLTLVTNRDPRPADAPEEPRAVRWLIAGAQSDGWEARVGFSRAELPGVRIGSIKVVEIFGVWGAHHETRMRFCAMHERTIGAATGWKWSTITLWDGRGKPIGGRLRFTYANRTDLGEFIAAQGRMLPAWYFGIAERVAKQEERTKLAAKSRPRKAAENGA